MGWRLHEPLSESSGTVGLLSSMVVHRGGLDCRQGWRFHEPLSESSGGVISGWLGLVCWMGSFALFSFSFSLLSMNKLFY
jgi:hypothetical protein